MQRSLDTTLAPQAAANFAAVPGSAGAAALGPHAIAKARQVIADNVWLIVSTVMGCLMLAGLYLVATPPKFTATSQILIENREAKVVSGNAVLSSLSADQYVIDTQVEILRSAKIANQAARSIGLIAPGQSLSTEQLKELHDNLEVERLGLTFVIQIAYTAANPRQAAAMSNAIAEAYLEDQRELKSKVIRQGQRWLKARTEQLRAEVVEADRRIQAYKARHKIVSSGDLTFGEQELAEYAKQLTEARSDLAEAEAKLAQRARNDYEISQTKVQVLEKGLDKLKRRLADHDKIVVGLNELKREAAAAARIYANFLTRLKETQAQDTLQSADARIISNALPPAAPSSPKKKIVLGLALAFGLSLGIMISIMKDAMQDLVRSREELAQLTGQADVIELPHVTTLSCRYVLASERAVLAPTDKAPEDAGPDDEVAYMASERREAYRIYRYVQDHPYTQYAQAMFLLKNTVLPPVENGIQNDGVIAVVSTNQGEGKTATAVHLARYAASTGLRTLLVDCDLRSPSLHEVCADVGGIDLLAAFEDGIDTEALFAAESYAGLTVITAPEPGTVANPIEFLASSAMAKFLAHCRDAFDVVILDTAALGPFFDTRALLGHADRAVVIAEAGMTSRGDLRKALGESGLGGHKIAAAVLNKNGMQEG